MQELLDLVDDQTEYFRGHLDALPPQERRVYLALADLWKPATTREVADRARLDASKCSAQLNRLIERGAVEVAGGSARRKQYCLTERLYNIYYLMRRSRGPKPVVEALVRFMEAFYSPGEWTDLGARVPGEDAAASEAESLRRLAPVHLMELPRLATYRDELLAGIPGDLAKDLARGFALSEMHRPAEALCALDEAIGRFGESSVPEASGMLAVAHVAQALALLELDRSEEARDAFEQAVTRLEQSGDDRVQNQIVPVLIGKAALELRFRRHAEAVETAGRALDPRLTPSSEDRLRGHLIRAEATLAGGQASSCKEDIERSLAILVELGSLPKGTVDALMSLSVGLGPADMHALIQASPAASLLSPLVTALEWELGMEPRVAREVEEVARDIRRVWRQ